MCDIVAESEFVCIQKIVDFPRRRFLVWFPPVDPEGEAFRDKVWQAGRLPTATAKKTKTP